MSWFSNKKKNELKLQMKALLYTLQIYRLKDWEVSYVHSLFWYSPVPVSSKAVINLKEFT